MKKILLLLPLLFFFFKSEAQRYGTQKRHSIDPVIGADYGLWILKATTPDTDLLTLLSTRRELESIKPIFRIGVNYNLSLSNILFVKTGIRFVNPGYRSTELLSLSPAEQIDLGYTSSTQGASQFSYTYRSFEMPLLLRWVYSGNRCKSYLEGGMAMHYYWQTNIQGYNENNKRLGRSFSLNENINKINWNAMLGIGAEFWLTDDIPIYVQLVGRYQITELINDAIDERFIGLGLESGLRWLF